MAIVAKAVAAANSGDSGIDDRLGDNDNSRGWSNWKGEKGEKGRVKEIMVMVIIIVVEEKTGAVNEIFVIDTGNVFV